MSTSVMVPALLEQATASAAATDRPEALRALRADGAASFATQGLPTTRNEDWHYTNVRSLTEQTFVPMTGAIDGVTAESLAAHRFDAAWPTFVFVNGRYQPSLSSVDALPEGVRVLPLADAVAQAPELVQRVLGRTAPVARDGFTALNAAFASEGVFLHVGKEMVSDVPVHVLFVTTDAGAQGMQHPRVLVLAERHARGGGGRRRHAHAPQGAAGRACGVPRGHHRGHAGA
ncbi:MAG: hypothetical protein MUD17_04085 [Gemmatimonadaceae bacterium]|nr:hypothetical protein [Gemmatimonadaceae bacterium]